MEGSESPPGFPSTAPSLKVERPSPHLQDTRTHALGHQGCRGLGEKPLRSHPAPGRGRLGVLPLLPPQAAGKAEGGRCVRKLDLLGGTCGKALARRTFSPPAVLGGAGQQDAGGQASDWRVDLSALEARSGPRIMLIC